MNPTIILSCIAAYFLLLFVISYITGKNDSNDTFFLGNRNSPWFVIAYGMIGTTLSGITFISVPGWVASSQFSYMQMVFGWAWITVGHIYCSGRTNQYRFIQMPL